MRRTKRLVRRLGASSQRFIAALSLCALLAASLGFPVVKPKPADTQNPYPCQTHACGCANAEACWQSCCCFSPAEKLAWALSHGVVPPDSLLAQACETKAQAACGSCGKHAEPLPSRYVKSATKATQPRSTMGLAIGDLVRKCQGLAPLWAVLGSALPAPHVEFVVECVPCEWVRVDNQWVASAMPDPPIPPPRLS